MVCYVWMDMLLSPLLPVRHASIPLLLLLASFAATAAAAAADTLLLRRLLLEVIPPNSHVVALARALRLNCGEVRVGWGKLRPNVGGCWLQRVHIALCQLSITKYTLTIDSCRR